MSVRPVSTYSSLDATGLLVSILTKLIKVESVAQSVSNLAIQFGDSDDEVGIMSRPFGVALLFAG